MSQQQQRQIRLDQQKATKANQTGSKKSLEKPPQGCGGIPVTGGFQDAIRDGAR